MIMTNSIDAEQKARDSSQCPRSPDDVARLCMLTLLRIRSISRAARRKDSKDSLRAALSAIHDLSDAAHNLPAFLMDEKTPFSSDEIALEKFCIESEKTLRDTSDMA